MSMPDNPDPQQRLRPAPRWYRRVAANLGLVTDENPRESIERAIEETANGADVFSAQERAMLLKALQFGRLRVSDVMVPRAEIVAIDAGASVERLLCLFAEAGHSRLPLYRDSLDDAIGMVHIKDLVTWMTQRALRGNCAVNPANDEVGEHTPVHPADFEGADGRVELNAIDMAMPVGDTGIMREVLFVPPSMPAVDLLLRMQAKQIHLALVIDEFGGTDGLVSIEDLVEEIVGNIEDEHDIDEIPPLKSDTLGYIASARTPIENIERHLGVTLNGRENEDDVDTLGGLLFAMAGRVPPRGEVIRHPSGVEFEVLEATPRRIIKVRIVRRPDGGGGGVRLIEDLRKSEGEASGRSLASHDMETDNPKSLPPAAEAA